MKRIIFILTILLAFIGYNNAQSKKPVAAKKPKELSKIRGSWTNIQLQELDKLGVSDRDLMQISPRYIYIDSFGKMRISYELEFLTEIGYPISKETKVEDSLLVYTYKNNIEISKLLGNDSLIFYCDTKKSIRASIVFRK